jgi:transcription initiation factor IIE alpha subunit
MISRTHAGIFDGFVNLDEYGLCKALKINLENLREQLKALEKNGIFEINWRIDEPQVTFIQERLPDTHFHLKPEVLKIRKEVALEKFSFVVDYLTQSICRSAQLVRYFGQKGEDCGICDVCKAKNKVNNADQHEKPKSIQEVILNFLSEPRSFLEIKMNLAQADETKIRELMFEMLDNRLIEFDGKLYKKKDRK